MIKALPWVMCHVNDCLIKPGLRFQHVLVSLKHLTRSAAAEGKGCDGQRDTEIQGSQPEARYCRVLLYFLIKLSAGRAHVQTNQEGQMLTGHGWDGIWRHSRDRGQRERPWSLSWTTHSDKGIWKSPGQLGWGWDWHNTGTTAGRCGTAMAHGGSLVWNGTEGAMMGTQTQGQALVSLPGVGDLKYWNKRDGWTHWSPAWYPEMERDIKSSHVNWLIPNNPSDLK